jgi:hypothetical protein
VISHLGRRGRAAARVGKDTGLLRKPATDELQLLVLLYNPMFTSIYNPLSISKNYNPLSISKNSIILSLSLRIL